MVLAGAGLETSSGVLGACPGAGVPARSSSRAAPSSPRHLQPLPMSLQPSSKQLWFNYSDALQQNFLNNSSGFYGTSFILLLSTCICSARERVSRGCRSPGHRGGAGPVTLSWGLSPSSPCPSWLRHSQQPQRTHPGASPLRKNATSAANS